MLTVIKGSMDREAFEACARNVLTPERQPDTALICDTFATHDNKAAAATLRDISC